MCFKTPKAPEPPKVTPPPTREMVSADTEQRTARRVAGQQGIFSNIRTSAFGDVNYDKNTEMAQFGAVGSVA